MARNRLRGMATSAIWNTTYRAQGTDLAGSCVLTCAHGPARCTQWKPVQTAFRRRFLPAMRLRHPPKAVLGNPGTNRAAAAAGDGIEMTSGRGEIEDEGGDPRTWAVRIKPRGCLHGPRGPASGPGESKSQRD